MHLSTGLSEIIRQSSAYSIGMLDSSDSLHEHFDLTDALLGLTESLLGYPFDGNGESTLLVFLRLLMLGKDPEVDILGVQQRGVQGYFEPKRVRYMQ